jgi:hypothetical protein
MLNAMNRPKWFQRRDRDTPGIVVSPGAEQTRPEHMSAPDATSEEVGSAGPPVGFDGRELLRSAWLGHNGSGM